MSYPRRSATRREKRDVNVFPGSRTPIEAVAISARAADALPALFFQKVELFKKGIRAPFVLCAEGAQWGEFRDQWVGRWDGIVQMVLRIGVTSVCSIPGTSTEHNYLIQLV
jgi:hypothetical protein